MTGSSAAPQSEPSSPSSSPRTIERRQIQNLTLPPIPNLVIPDSPPGSPRPSTVAKIQSFLALKQKGIHFNAKLADSKALRNPNLLHGLLQFAGIDQTAQYANTLPEDCAIFPPGPIPAEAYTENLDKKQAAGLEEKRGKKRDRLDFVNASEPSSDRSTPSRPGSTGDSKRSKQAKQKDALPRRSRFDQGSRA